jgi:hypothetical protein
MASAHALETPISHQPAQRRRYSLLTGHGAHAIGFKQGFLVLARRILDRSRGKGRRGNRHAQRQCLATYAVHGEISDKAMAGRWENLSSLQAVEDRIGQRRSPQGLMSVISWQLAGNQRGPAIMTVVGELRGGSGFHYLRPETHVEQLLDQLIERREIMAFDFYMVIIY